MIKMMTRVLAGLLAAALTGCAAQSAPQPEQGEQALTICASFYTMADFAQKIAGDRAQVVNLVPAGGEPHDWEPSAQDIAQLERAQLLVVNGAGFEHWVDRVVPTLANTSLRVVDTTERIDLLDERPRDGDDHIGDDQHPHAEEEAHGHDDDGDHGDKQGHSHDIDPHVWLNPLYARAQMEAIRDALCQVDPDGAGVYGENFDQWAAACEGLDSEYRAAIDALPGREIVVAHEAFGYLCRRYGLEQVAAQGLSPDGEPDPARMADVVDYARDHDVKVIFFEETASPKVAEAIAREIGAETAVLSPLESLSEQQAAQGGDYFSVMRENLEQLKVALA